MLTIEFSRGTFVFPTVKLGNRSVGYCFIKNSGSPYADFHRGKIKIGLDYRHLKTFRRNIYFANYQ